MGNPVFKEDKKCSVIEHLEELRNRIICCLFLIIVCSVLVYAVIPRIVKFIIQPVGKVYFMGPAEAFCVQVKLSFFIGLYCAMPFIFYQAWRFVEIGLKQREKILVLPFAVFSFLLFVMGGSFCYFLVIPAAIKFFLSYGSDILVPLISASKYISFVGSFVFAFGITFQLPLIVLFFSRMGIINARLLRKFRKFAILGSFVIGAALTPTPDVVNQSLMAIPIIVLYELSIWLLKIFEKN